MTNTKLLYQLLKSQPGAAQSQQDMFDIWDKNLRNGLWIAINLSTDDCVKANPDQDPRETWNSISLIYIGRECWSFDNDEIEIYANIAQAEIPDLSESDYLNEIYALGMLLYSMKKTQHFPNTVAEYQFMRANPVRQRP